MFEEKNTYSTGELLQTAIYKAGLIHRTGYYQNGDIWYIDVIDNKGNYQGLSSVFYYDNIIMMVNVYKNDIEHGARVHFGCDCVNYIDKIN